MAAGARPFLYRLRPRAASPSLAFPPTWAAKGGSRSRGERLWGGPAPRCGPSCARCADGPECGCLGPGAPRSAAVDASGRGHRPRVPGAWGAGASSSAEEVRSLLCRAGGPAEARARGLRAQVPAVSKPSAPALTSSRRAGAGPSRALAACRGPCSLPPALAADLRGRPRGCPALNSPVQGCGEGD